MFAGIAAIMPIILQVASSAVALLQLGKDVAPQIVDLKRLISGEKITESELLEIRARNDALNAEIEALKE